MRLPCTLRFKYRRRRALNSAHIVGRTGMTAKSPRTTHDPVVVLIATILEQEHVDRIASVDPQRVRIIYRPDLQPPSRYLADHHGPSDWTRAPADEAEYRSLLSQAEVLWDFADIRDASPLDLSPKLKW